LRQAVERMRQREDEVTVRCPRRLNFEPPCRLNFEPGAEANL
jgi:hypothetical protein